MMLLLLLFVLFPCPGLLVDDVPVQSTNNERFTVEVSGKQLTVTRVDKEEGWTSDLIFKYYPPAKVSCCYLLHVVVVCGCLLSLIGCSYYCVVDVVLLLILWFFYVSYVVRCGCEL